MIWIWCSALCEARRNPWFNMVKTVDDHVEQVCKSEFTGRQQAPDVYDVNASIYVFKRDFPRHQHGRHAVARQDRHQRDDGYRHY